MIGVEGYDCPDAWHVAVVCEVFKVDPARAMWLIKHPTWSRLTRQVMDLLSYRDTLAQYRSKRQNQINTLRDDLPFLKDVHNNHFDLTRELAAQRMARRMAPDG